MFGRAVTLVIAAALAACGSAPTEPGAASYEMTQLSLSEWAPPWRSTDEAYPPWYTEPGSYLRLVMHPDGALDGEGLIWVRCYYTEPETQQVELFAREAFLAAPTLEALSLAGTWAERDGMVWLEPADAGAAWMSVQGWLREGATLALDVEVEGLVLQASLRHR